MDHRRIHLQLTAAAKAGISERSGRRIDRDPTLPSQRKKGRAYRTRANPFEGIWDAEIVPLVRLTIRRFDAARLNWPLPDDVTDAEVLLASAGAGPGTPRRGQRRQTEPDRTAVHRELKRKQVTQSIVWEE